MWEFPLGMREEEKKITEKRNHYLWKTISCHHNAIFRMKYIFDLLNILIFYFFIHKTFVKIYSFIIWWSCGWASTNKKKRRKNVIEMNRFISYARTWISYCEFAIEFRDFFSLLCIVVFPLIISFFGFFLFLWQTNKMWKSFSIEMNKFVGPQNIKIFLFAPFTVDKLFNRTLFLFVKTLNTIINWPSMLFIAKTLCILPCH